jgi:hypothetical protein
LPVIPIIFIFILIPDALQTDRLLDAAVAEPAIADHEDAVADPDPE